MAAPFGKWILRRIPRILSKFAASKEVLGTKTTYRIGVHSQGFQDSKRLNNHGIFSVNFARALLLTGFRKTGFGSPSVDRSQRLSTGAGRPDDGEGGNMRHLKLMEFNEIIWPHPLKSLRNALFTFLIKGYFDDSYSTTNFLNGAEQAVKCVSDLISRGEFDQLDGLVTREAQRELKRNYEKLSLQQRQFIAVNPEDVFFRFVYEIGMIIDDQTNERFVEITAVFQGVHGMDEARSRDPETFSDEMQQARDQVYVCNYRFIREYTKGKDENWIINKLNHFKAKELAANTNIFRR